MSRTVKHLSLHRIAGTELRVIADVENGVIPLIEVEEAVVREYAAKGNWPHHWVELFILHDLQPLVRQLRSGPRSAGLHPSGSLPAGEATSLEQRPVVNIYDLANPASCHVFVNQQAMVKEGYWDDILAIRALLAHEHAHPLAENETTRLSRQLRLDLTLEQIPSATRTSARVAREQPVEDPMRAVDWEDRIVPRLITPLAEKLCLYAPREIFANELTIRSNFDRALLHLDRRNIANAKESIKGREGLRQQLQQEVSQGKLTPATSDLLLLIGDLRGYLDLTMEVAPFYRAGHESEARELESVLESAIFPQVEPQVAAAYATLREQYIALGPNLQPTEMISWGARVLRILAEALGERGLLLRHRLWMADD